MNDKNTHVFIYEGDKRLEGEIIAETKDSYIIAWQDGETTTEPIKDFNPQGWW
jgi:hypothetical protein